MDFTWAVTKGINMSTMAGGLPRHLQLEITLRLNRPMVAKWCGAVEFDPPPLCLPLLASGRDQAVIKPWSSRGRAVIEPWSSRDRAAIEPRLRSPLFADLDEGLVEDVVSKLQFMTIIAGEFVFYEGMPGSRCACSSAS